MKRGALVVLTTNGYINRFGTIQHETFKDRDGVRQFRVSLRHSLMELTFRVDEFREATEAEVEYAAKNPKERSCG